MEGLRCIGDATKLAQSTLSMYRWPCTSMHGSNGRRGPVPEGGGEPSTLRCTNSRRTPPRAVQAQALA